MNLIEKRDFKRLASWMDRLTTNNLIAIPLEDVNFIDALIDRLEDHGMIINNE